MAAGTTERTAGSEAEQASPSARFEVAGKPVVCPHCGGEVFVDGCLQLDDANVRFRGIDCRGKVNHLLMCVDCTRVEWFGYEPQRRRDVRFEQGAAGIAAAGHRKYVGGLWEQLGRLQLDFLLREGLRPEHVLLDIACGSLRAGVHLIPYLNAGHYLGIDKEQALIEAGVRDELSAQVRAVKQPRFVASDAFEFEQFNARPDYALAQSLFSHLPEEPIRTCFQKLRQVIADDGLFYATFFEAEQAQSNASSAHDHQRFQYTRQQIEAFGRDTGWTPEYIGEWGHPRGQIMVRFRPR